MIRAIVMVTCIHTSTEGRAAATCHQVSPLGPPLYSRILSQEGAGKIGVGGGQLRTPSNIELILSSQRAKICALFSQNNDAINI